MASNNKRWLQQTYTNWAFGAICPQALEFASVGGKFVSIAAEESLLSAFVTPLLVKPLRVEFPNVWFGSWLPSVPTKLTITRN